MNDNTIKNKCFNYFIYSLLAWDLKDRKVEDDSRKNDRYFFSEKYKKEFCKILNTYRKKNIIKIDYRGNDATSTNYNVYEKSDGEVIIAYRGSDSTLDWLADFAFFKTNFKNENTEALLNMSTEEVNSICMKEFCKSMEENCLDAKYFKSASLKKLSDFTFDFLDDNIFDDMKAIFETFKNKIKLHGGFITQYMSISKDIDFITNKYLNDKRFNKIIFVGHSLGSSLAQLSYIFQSIKHSDQKNKFSCYVAGTPKIGNFMLMKFLKVSGLRKNLYVMNISGDMVSCLPPNKFGFVENETDVEIEPIKAPFPTKMNHTLFYYLYCIQNYANVKVKKDKIII